jgi:hypothetical protein
MARSTLMRCPAVKEFLKSVHCNKMGEFSPYIGKIQGRVQVLDEETNKF